MKNGAVFPLYLSSLVLVTLTTELVLLLIDEAVAEKLPVGHMQWQPQFGSDDSDDEADGASLSARYVGHMQIGLMFFNKIVNSLRVGAGQ